MEQNKIDRANEERANREAGHPGDIDFQRMIARHREEAEPAHPHHAPDEPMKICIAVRKRPISSREVKKYDHDSVSCGNPVVTVHDCKFRVDGISKYLDNVSFEVDHTFSEEESTADVYNYCIQPLIPFVTGRNAGRATVFAYGQTGSGKTFTMMGIQRYIAEDLFASIEGGAPLDVFVSFFEIYGGRCQDLLNERSRLNIREDGGGEVVVGDLCELRVADAEEMLGVIETGNANRTTHATESNDVSSRSHAICQVSLRSASGKLAGKLSLIDLAGSERGADTTSNNRQRRLEGAEINKSLLALKECIRALDSNSTHVPYRASKLTLVLKDAFTRSSAKTVMIACVSPAASSADHTINTLRYADRIKERTVGSHAAAAKQQVSPAPSSLQAKGNDRPRDPLPAPPVNKPAPGRRAETKAAEPLEEMYEDSDVNEFHRTIESLFEEEEELLNLHMNIIQESAELLTEEGRLLQQIQNDDNDIDAYAARLDEILARKQSLITVLRAKLGSFRECLRKEESVSDNMKRNSVR
jgi:kinesin family protein 2/24